MNNIVLVDKNENWIKIFADFFHTVDYTVAVYASAGDLLNTSFKVKIADAIVYPLYSESTDQDLVRQLKIRFAKTPLIIFATNPEIPDCIEFLKNRADGLVVKKDGLFALFTAITACSQGGIYISPTLNKALIAHFLFGDVTRLGIHLSAKEKEIIGVLKEGLSYKQMANKMGITSFTVNHHLKKMYKKFGVNSRTQLMAMLEKVKIDYK